MNAIALFATLFAMRKDRLVFLLCVLLLGAGIVVRAFSIQWNVIPHGDVDMDARMGASFLRYGEFLDESLITRGTNPESYSLQERRSLFMAQHPPVWPLLGAGLTALRRAEASVEQVYISFKILSLLSGLLVIALSAALAFLILDRTRAAIIAVWLSCSYLMIDYSGNGAFLSLQTALYLAWILAAYKLGFGKKVIALGLLTGIAYLVNFQCIILFPAGMVLLLFEKNRTWMQKILGIVCFLGIAFPVIAPWLLRNWHLFHDPMYSHYINSIYIYMKAGIAPVQQGGESVFRVSIGEWFSIVEGVLRVWLPNNLYYMARKLFILAPIAFVFFSFGLIEYLFSPARLRSLLPILLIVSLHILLSAAWPVTKFRYFVPILPFVFLLSLEYIFSLPWVLRTKMAWVSAVSVLIVIFSFWTYAAIPTHTYYYDGAITSDPFHGSQELEFVKSHHLLPSSSR